MTSFKNVLIITIGFVFFNLLFPVIGIHFNSLTSFNFPAYDYIFISYLFIIFLLIPISVLLCLCMVLNKLKINCNNFVLFVFILCVLKQIEFHISTKYFIQSNIVDLKIISIYLFILVLSIFVYFLSKKHIEYFYKFNAIIVFSGAFVLIFLLYDISNIIKSKNYNKNNSKEMSEINKTNKKIFILTFEKIARDLIINEKGNVKKEFISLKKLEKNSTVFTNFRSSSTQTFQALDVLYSGGFIKSPKSDENKLKTSLFKKLHDSGYKIHYINDLLNFPCRIMYINCYKTNLGEKNIVNRSIMAKRWVYSLLQYYIPHFLLMHINPTYEFDFKYVSRDEKKETQNFINILKNTKNEKAAYIAHFFLSDGYTNLDEVNKLKRNSLQQFDIFISKLYEYLKNKKMYDNSFIAILSDTGSELSNIKMVYGSVKDQTYHSNSDNIFSLIKNFNQLNPEKNSNYFSLFDFNKLFDHLLKNNTVKNNFEGNKKYYNKLFQFTDTGIVEYLKNDNKWIRQ